MHRLRIYVAVQLLHLGISAQDEYFFNQFTTRQGLSNNSVNHILQDDNGFIWIATDDGLNRFDGHQFKIFRNIPGDTASIAANNVVSICKDRDGNIWCAGSGWNYVSVFDYRSLLFRNYSLSAGMEAFDVTSIFCDGEGNIWVGSSTSLFRFNHSLEAFENLTAVKSNDYDWKARNISRYHAFCEDDIHNGFWLAANTGIHFFSYSAQKFLHEKNNTQGKWIFGANSNRPLILDEDGNLWLCAHFNKEKYWTWVGYDYDLDSIFYINDHVRLNGERLANNFFSLSRSPDNKLWLGNNARTPTIFDVESREFDYSLAKLYPGSLTNHTLRATCFDRDGNIWVGMEEGLFVSYSFYKDISVKWIGKQDEFRKPRIKCIYQPDSMSLMIAANNEIYWWDKTTDSITEYPHIIDGVYLNDGLRYLSWKSDEEVWAPSFFGLYSFNLKTKKFTDEITALPEEWRRRIKVNSAIKHVITNTDGYTYLMSDKGIYIFNHSKGFYRYEMAYADEDRAMSVLSYSNKEGGGFWFTDAIHNSILYIDSHESAIQRLNLPMQSAIMAKSLCDDGKGNLWIGTIDQGVVRYDMMSGQLENYSIQQGIHSNAVYKILTDENAHIWVVTSNGIARYNEQLNLFEKVFSEYSLPNYDHRDVGYLGIDQQLHFFSQNIFYSIRPDNIKSANRDKLVLITSRMVNDKSVSDSILSSLHYSQNNVRFEFSVLNFNPNSAVRYEYMLAGSDNIWRSTNGESSVQFNALPYGNYIFKVRSDNGTGILSERFTEVSFKILPPWYSTWWFRILIVLLFVLALWLIVREYTRRKISKRETELEKIRLVETERMRIARDMHDDLGGGLSTIRMVSESALRRPDESKLKEISSSAGELLDNMRQIVWTLNEEENSIEDLSYYILTYAREFLGKRNVTITVGSHNQDQRILTSKQRRNIFLTVKEALHNVIQHSGASHVELTIVPDARTLSIVISDNGQGMPRVAENKHGNGLKNMRQRLEDIGGSITFTTQDGFTVQLTIPLKMS